MLPRNHPDRIDVAFDDRRLVNNAGLILPATLALHLGLPELVDRRLDLGDAPGRANTGDKIMTLVASALCIDDADAHHARSQGALQTAQLPVGPRPSVPGEPRAAVEPTRHSRPGLHHLRDLLARRGPPMATPASTRCWPWPLAPARC